MLKHTVLIRSILERGSLPDLPGTVQEVVIPRHQPCLSD